MKMRIIKTALSAICLAALIGAAQAAPVTYDETLYQTTTGDPSQLSANLSMSYSGGILSITLQNISGAGAGDAAALAAAMISGIAFNLPSGVSVTGGSITPIGTQSPNPWDLPTANGQWGYANDGSGGALTHALLSYNAESSTMASDVNQTFVGPPPPNADGLNYGAVSLNIAAPGTPNVVDTIQLDLSVSGWGGSDAGLVTAIDGGNIAVIFGSADASSLPDGGTTIALLGFALVGVGALRRKLSKN
jgi:hypothetical protein